MPSSRPVAPVRPWRGVSATERTAERRERLIEAALEVFATRGYSASTVRDVCREAGLTERYFYESFRNREALLAALADRIVDDSRTSRALSRRRSATRSGASSARSSTTRAAPRSCSSRPWG
jgi:AcrR family transcriptional regulator